MVFFRKNIISPKQRKKVLSMGMSSLGYTHSFFLIGKKNGNTSATGATNFTLFGVKSSLELYPPQYYKPYGGQGVVLH